MTQGEQVKDLYSEYPYPSPLVGKSLSYDIASLLHILQPHDDLSQRKILDAGCGTGHRTLGLAKRYPRATVCGIDVVEASLKVALRLAEAHGINNVRFEAHDIMSLSLSESFDFILSTGVIHHLEHPEKGLVNLCQHLSDGGAICIWVYHPFGEFDRLIKRELLQTLWGNERSDLSEGRQLMEKLGLDLSPEQYGHWAALLRESYCQLSVNADAFMHPIVNSYRFAEAMALFKGCEVDWVAVNGMNCRETTRLIDLENHEESWREFCLRDQDLFQDESLLDRYRALPKIERLAVIELLMKPNGFTILAGRRESYNKVGKRMEGNLIWMAEIPRADNLA
jgi:trans-aconitate methyltransferase